MSTPKPRSDDLVTPFIFVSEGRPEPKEWLAEHPGAMKIPARLVQQETKDDAEPGYRLQADFNRLFEDLSVYSSTTKAEETPELPPTTSAPEKSEERTTRIDPANEYLRAVDALPSYLRPGASMRPASPDKTPETESTETLKSYDPETPLPENPRTSSAKDGTKT